MSHLGYQVAFLCDVTGRNKVYEFAGWQARTEELSMGV